MNCSCLSLLLSNPHSDPPFRSAPHSCRIQSSYFTSRFSHLSFFLHRDFSQVRTTRRAASILEQPLPIADLTAFERAVLAATPDARSGTVPSGVTE
jgi:hypothetical protein